MVVGRWSLAVRRSMIAKEGSDQVRAASSPELKPQVFRATSERPEGLPFQSALNRPSLELPTLTIGFSPLLLFLILLLTRPGPLVWPAEKGKVAGKRNANFLRLGSCASLQLSLASKSESRPAALVMVVTDF